MLSDKYDSKGKIERRKARLVAKGYSQQPGLDFNETFAPVVRLELIRLRIALAVKNKMHIYINLISQLHF